MTLNEVRDCPLPKLYIYHTLGSPNLIIPLSSVENKISLTQFICLPEKKFYYSIMDANISCSSWKSVLLTSSVLHRG